MSIKKIAKLLTNKKVLKVGMMALSHPTVRKALMKQVKKVTKR